MADKDEEELLMTLAKKHISSDSFEAITTIIS